MKMKRIAVVITISVALFAAAYWGYIRGIEAQATLDPLYIPVIQGLSVCHEKRDWECVEVTNKVMSVMLASRLEVLVEKAMIEESVRDDVEAFLEWHDATWVD